jgi:chromosome segregation ATPase
MSDKQLSVMKNIIVVILTVVSLILGIALLIQHTQSRKQIEAAKSENTWLAGELTSARSKQDEQEKVIGQLESNIAKQKEQLTAKAGELDKVAADLAKVQLDYKSALAEVQKQSAHIAELESQRTGLTSKMDDLQGSITSLESQISDTKKKLALSEGDRQELLAQLKRLESEKSDLVAQFNNISALRTQLAKLKDEASIAQRLAWIRSGVYANQEKKGAERLLAEASDKKPKVDNRLNVEVDQNGGAKVIPKTTAPVN